METVSDQVEQQETFEGDIHVSFKSVKNTVPPAQYKMQLTGYEFVTAQTGTNGVKVRLNYDKSRHPEYEKRSLYVRFWFSPTAMNIFLGFLYAMDIDKSLLAEVEIPGVFVDDGTGKQVPATKCASSVKQQLDAIYGNFCYVQVIEEQRDGIAADGVTPEKQWFNDVAPRGFSKI